MNRELVLKAIELFYYNALQAPNRESLVGKMDYLLTMELGLLTLACRETRAQLRRGLIPSFSVSGLPESMASPEHLPWEVFPFTFYDPSLSD